MNSIAVLIFLLAVTDIVKCELICRTPEPVPLQHTIEGQLDNTEKRAVIPLRLKFYVSYTSNFNYLSDAPKLKRLVEGAVKFWENTLTVKNPGKGKQLVKRYCDNDYYYTAIGNNSVYCIDSNCKSKAMCGSVEIPDDYAAECFVQDNYKLKQQYSNGTGVPGNGYILIVDAGETGLCSGGAAAFAGSCHMDSNTDRPNVGFMNLCPSKMDFTYPSVKALPGIMIHEIGHALGFSSSNFPYMRDEKGKPRTQRDSSNQPIYKDEYGRYISSNTTIRMITRPWQSAAGSYTKTSGSFVTPKILAAAKKHFNCQQLDGVDLETYNIMGPVGSHWAPRILESEVMAPRILINYAVSAITLALFEDSGWYKVNYKKAMDLQYGKKLGCEFATKSCYEYANIQRSKHQKFLPFCDDNRQATCRDAYSYGICSISLYPSAIPEKDRFFATQPFPSRYGAAHYGGNDAHRDFCPTQTYISSLGKDYTATSFCTHTENIQRSKQGTNYYFQTYGKKSICLEHRGTWLYKAHYLATLGNYLQGSCHTYECSKTTKKLSVLFKSTKVICPINGGQISFNVTDGAVRLVGSIVCPKSKDFCK